MEKKCCVGNCTSTKATHRLFTLPMNDRLRNLWLSFLVPTNPQLIGCGYQTLKHRRVCEVHFEKDHFDQQGRKLRFAYPTLFSKSEIEHGVPLSSHSVDVNHLVEHAYHMAIHDEQDCVELATGTTDQIHLIDHNYCKKKIEDNNGSWNKPSCSSIAEKPVNHDKAQTIVSKCKKTTISIPSDLWNQPSCSSIADKPVGHDKAQTIVSKCKETTISIPSVAARLQNKKKRKLQYINRLKNITVASQCKTAKERIKMAQDFERSDKLFKNFPLLSKTSQLFIMMQLKQCGKSKKSRRYTREEKIIALAIMKRSPKAYRLLERMFDLPTKRTLSKATENITVEPGLNSMMFEYLKKKAMTWKSIEKLCSIVYDEIALTPNFTYTSKTDKIHGFVDVAGHKSMKIADHAIVFMLRGICSSWRQCVAYYFIEGTISAASLQNILKQIVTKVVEVGLTPLGLVSDQGSTFRSAIKNMRETTLQARNSQGIIDDGTINVAGHNLSCFYDPPHLLKGIRNNFITKDIIWKKETATWEEIRRIYDLDMKMGHTRACPKLTACHVDPAKMKKMKVCVAAQVLSNRVASLLYYSHSLLESQGINSPVTKTTAEVVEFFNDLFDSVNGIPGASTRGTLRKAVKPNSEHVEFWHKAIKSLKEIKFKDSNSKAAVNSGKPRFVRVPSLDGWISTLESFIRVSKILFNNYKVDYFYPRYINQDPLENYFGRIRALNYRNVNPDPWTFMMSYKTILLSNVISPDSKYGNCEADDGETILDLNDFFESCESNKENDSPLVSPSSVSQEHQISSGSKNLKERVVHEKIEVQCSAYTAGYICRKITNNLKCKNCTQTLTTSQNDGIHKYINFREYKRLKHKRLGYPSEKLVILYRSATNLIHNYLNENGNKNLVGLTIKKLLKCQLGFSDLGCPKHKNNVRDLFVGIVTKIHIFNWCNILNKILRGTLEEKHVDKGIMQNLAIKKYKTHRLRSKKLNK